jgi:polyhydroxybutyrate depolymerase
MLRTEVIMRRVSLLSLAALALLLLLPTGCAAAGDPLRTPGDHSLEIDAAGHTWTCHVYLPAGYDGRSTRPLVLVLHGAGGSGETYLSKAGWARQADAAGCFVAAPDGLPARPELPANFLLNPRLWNTGQLTPGSPRSRIDDLAFFRALLDELARRLPVDPRRVFVTGHSNGAGMTFRLGAELSGRFAALAPVAGLCWQAAPRPAHPPPTRCLYGTADPLVPLNGGESVLPWGGRRTTPPVSDVLARWARGLGCPPAPQSDQTDGILRTEVYGPGRDGATLTVVIIQGQGHGWPGGSPVLPKKIMGPTVDGVDATAMIWRFFSEHPMGKR